MDIVFVARLVLYFTIFSVVGYIIEVILCSLGQKRVVNRGFLFGPYLPIYGFGGIIMMFVTQDFRDNFLLTFLASAAVGAIIEYLTSFILEKIFHVRWWDYSLTDKFNLNGRICMRNTLAFGIGGCILLYSALPIVNSVLDIMPPIVQIVIASIFAVIFLIDTIFSSYVNSKVTSMADFDQFIGDQTNEIKKYAKLFVKQIFARTKKAKKAAEKELKRQQKIIKRQKKKIEKLLKTQRRTAEKLVQESKKSARKISHKSKSKN